MRLYERSDGTIAGTQAEAGKGFRQIDVPTDKAGLIDYLNRNRHIPCECHGAGPDAIRKLAEAEVARAAIADVRRESDRRPEGYAEKANRFEDEFDAMPLATQLHYAERALENARDRL